MPFSKRDARDNRPFLCIFTMQMEKTKLDNTELAAKLIDWYLQNKRDLPWRKTSDPYKIWISEIILQQTRVAQGWEYYNKMLLHFPTVTDLASAREEEILRVWQGLGYYSRARNMHTAAKDITTRFGGKIPADYEAVRSLKGIGEYTAAAILSFAWNLPYAVVDGNVYRVLSRLFAIDIPIDSVKGKRFFFNLAQSLLPVGKAGIFNQALMELGALQCVARNPDCHVCPLQNRCLGYAENKVSCYPVKSKKMLKKNRFFTFLYIHNDENVILVRRNSEDIWKGLFQFPLIETDHLLDITEINDTDFCSALEKNTNACINSVKDMPKHVLSHQILFARFIEIRMTDLSFFTSSPYIIVEYTHLNEYAFPVLIKRYWESFQH